MYSFYQFAPRLQIKKREEKNNQANWLIFLLIINRNLHTLTYTHQTWTIFNENMYE